MVPAQIATKERDREYRTLFDRIPDALSKPVIPAELTREIQRIVMTGVPPTSADKR